MKKEAKELARLLEREHGLQVGYDGRDHYVVRDPKREYLVVGRFSATPSDHRWRDNAVQDLIKAGALKTDPYKAGGSVITEEKPHTSNLDVAAAMRAHEARTKHVKAEVERLFTELGHVEGMAGTNSSGVPTTFVRRAAEVASENGDKRESSSLMTSLWQLRHDKRVPAGVLDLFEKVIHEWDNNVGRPEKHTPAVAKQRVRAMQETRSTNRSAKKAAPTETLTCEECGKEFDSAQGLSLHMVSHRIETCGLCGAEVPLNAMGQHMKAHRVTGTVTAPEAPAKERSRIYLDDYRDIRQKRIGAISARLDKLAAEGSIPEFVEFAADYVLGNAAKQTESKKKSNLRQTVSRIRTGASTRLQTSTIETFEAAFKDWDERNDTKKTVGPFPAPSEELVKQAAPDATGKDATIDAILTLVSRSGGGDDARVAAKLLLKQLL